MSVDVACADAAFLDLTFAGLEALPGPGEERYAHDLLRSPGGAATTAIGAARLGLAAALVSPLGSDAEGEFVRAALEREGVRCTGRAVPRTAVTAVLPVDGERAMATFDPQEAATAEDVAAVEPTAVIASLPLLGIAPDGARFYATTGDDGARAHAGSPPAALAGAHALLVNEREARLLTGAATAEDAAARLGDHVPCAVVTLGARGALASEGGALVRAPGVPADVVDTTGAGDLFAAAYVWADAGGLPLAERLQWAVLYAALSVGVPTAVAGAATVDALVRAGQELGLAPPALPTTASRRDA